VAPDGRAATPRWLSPSSLSRRPSPTSPGTSPSCSDPAGVHRRAATYRGADRAVVTYTGAADVDRVLIVESAGGERVLSWKSLHAETIRFGLAPDRLAIDERLAELDGRLVIFRDKSLNLGKLMKPAAAPPGAPSASGPVAAAPAAGSDAAAGFPWSWSARIDEAR
jgi:hypothetical protein